MRPGKVMFPAKPASFTRTIDLDGAQVSMTMTAADVDGATFADRHGRGGGRGAGTGRSCRR
jgi:hypothetical protein